MLLFFSTINIFNNKEYTMKKIIRLTESDVSRIVRKVLSEQDFGISDFFVNQGKKLVSQSQQQGGGMKKLSKTISGGLANAKDTLAWKKYPCIINNPNFNNKKSFKSKKDGSLVYSIPSKKHHKNYNFYNSGKVIDSNNSVGTFRCVGGRVGIKWQSGPAKKYYDSKKQQTTKPPVKTTGQKPLPTTKPTTPVKPTTQPVKPVTTGPTQTQFTPSPEAAPETFDDSQIPLAEKYYLRRYSR